MTAEESPVIVMFLFFSDEAAVAGLDQAGRNGLVERHVRFNHDVLEKRATVLATRGLQPTRSAVTVRPTGGGPRVTEGPHAAAAESLAGFYLVECRDMDEAVELARAYPMPDGLGCIELRPVMQAWDYAPFVDVAAEPSRVWRRYADVSGWPEWTDGVDGAELDGPLAAGASGWLVSGGRRTALRVVAATVDEGYVSETEVAPGVWLRLEHILAPLPGGGTRVTHRATIPRGALDHHGLDFSPRFNAGVRASLRRLADALGAADRATPDPAAPDPAAPAPAGAPAAPAPAGAAPDHRAAPQEETRVP